MKARVKHTGEWITVNPCNDGFYEVNTHDIYEPDELDFALSLALTLEQVVKLDNIIMNMVAEGYNDGYKTRPFYEEVLRRFNEQYRKK